MRAYDGGVIMTVNFNGAGPGEYRIAVHANGNCSSPNAFSAGPPWAPPGVAIASPTVFKNDESASLSVRLPGYRIEGPDGVSGRSVVVHAGSRDSLDAQPGVSNGRIACGVIGTPRSLLAPFT
jgi:Cu-Zn family superoxide dismutase